jgi:CheY-like chemotaxis protein/anti-sigma regulatory factor (Ser/Thr protein kinase)
MKRILIVDDDRATRHLVRSFLEKARYLVDEAENGAAGLEKIAAGKYDLVLLDVWMPEMTGLDMLNHLRQRRAAPRAIIMTTDETPETVLRAVREQAYLYVRKPVERQHLLDVVAEGLARRRKPRPIEVVSARPNWVELLVPCEREAATRIQSFLMQLKGDLPESVRQSVGQAFHELLLNTIEWGGKFNPRRKVRIAYVRTERLLIYRIADPGQGFRFEDLVHSALANPDEEPFRHTEVREQKGLRPGGFGLLMTKAMVDELVYNEKQNEVLFVKYLT